jgi:O-antigen ligase/tetratricopeptide (TPR) repeat protein
MTERRSRRHSGSDSARKIDEAPASPFLGTGTEQARFYTLLAFLALCALGGGASRPDVLSLLYLRPAAIICLLVLILTPGRFEFRRFRFLFLLLGLFAVTIAVQLIPLPPDLWLSLPGHGRFAEGAAAASTPLPWRPLSLTPDLTLNSLLALLPPLVILVGLAAIREDQRRALLLVLIWIICADAVWSVVQFASGANSATYLYAVTNQGTPVGLFANRNHHAMLAAIGFPILALWLRMPSVSRERLRTRRWMALGIGMFLVLVIAVAGSRAGLVLGIVGILFALLLTPRSREMSVGRDRAIRAALLLVPIGLVAFTMFAHRATSLERLTGGDANPAAEVRIESLPTLVQMTREFLPLGSGFGGFDPAFRIYEPDAALGPTYFNHAHNELIELALTGGVPALLVLLLFLGWWLARGSRWFIRNRSHLLSADFARLGAILVLLLLGASLADYPLRTPMLSVVFTIACGWLALTLPVEEPEATRERRRRSSGIGRFLVAIPLALAFGWVALGVTAARTIGTERPSAVLGWWPFDADARATAANLRLNSANARPDPAALAEAESLARAALQREPGNVHAYRALGLAASVRGQGPRAERLMRFAESLSRRDLPTELWLIEANVQRNDIEGALRHYDRALRTSLLAGEVLYPVLIQAAGNRDVMLPIARMVGARPLWWTDFARRLVTESRSPAAIASVIAALRLDPHVEAERDLLVAAFNKLIEGRAYAAAFTIYRQAVRLGDGSPALFLRNGDFQGENPIPPFDWALTDQTDLGARMDSPAGGGDDRALIVTAGNGTSGEAARQFIMLPAGAYRLTARVGNVTGEERDRPQLVLLCAPGTRALFDLRWPLSPAQGQPISQDFTVPADCPALWLSIRANGPLNTTPPESWIDAIAIRRRP